jgi:hypothetical protein
MTAIALLLADELYIKAPAASLIVALVKDTLSKSTKAVVPDNDTATFASVAPPAVYPVPLDSFVVEYAVVVASSVALDVNNAIFNV